MIKRLTLASIIGATALATTAAATEANQTYVQLNAGPSYGLAPKEDMGPKTMKPAGVYGLEVGHKFNDHLRVGVGVDYRVGYVSKDYAEAEDIYDNLLSENQKWSFKSLAIMTNIYYDITQVYGITPYITVGAGVAKNRVKETLYLSENHANTEEYNSKGKEYNFAYKVGLGAKYSVNQKIDLDLRYQFANLGKLRSDATMYDPAVTRGKLRAREVMIGMTYNF